MRNFSLFFILFFFSIQTFSQIQACQPLINSENQYYKSAESEINNTIYKYIVTNRTERKHFNVP